MTGESDMGIADEKMPAPAVEAGGALLLGPAVAEKKVEADPGLIAGDCVLSGPRDGDGVSRLTRGAKLGASSMRPVLVAGLEKLPPFAYGLPSVAPRPPRSGVRGGNLLEATDVALILALF